MLAAILATAFAACTNGELQEEPRPVDCAPATFEWRRVATEEDRERLRDWREAFEDGLEQARGAGFGGVLASEGALLEPDAALPDIRPPVGDYDCRTIKIGSQADDLLSYVVYPAFHCRVSMSGDRISFTKVSGSQRPIGRLFPDEGRRMVFLGTMQLGDEGRSYQYGVDRERDLIAALERVGEQRWRLVFPYPHFESLVDVIELRPRQAR